MFSPNDILVAQIYRNADGLCGPVLVLGGGPAQLQFFESLIEMNIEVVLVDQDECCLCRALSHEFILGSTHDESEWIDQLLRYHKKNQVTNIFVVSSGPPVRTAANVAKQLGIEVISHEAALVATSKQQFKNFFQKNSGSRVNATRRQSGSESQWPKVLRADSSIYGKRAVKCVFNQRMYEQAFPELKAISITGDVICDPYLPGIDYIFAGVVKNGLLRFLAAFVEKNLFSEQGHLIPVGIYGPVFTPKFVTIFAKEKIKEMIDDLGIYTSPLALSVRVNNKHVHPIELHLDFGGELIFDWLMRPLFPTGLSQVLSFLTHQREPLCEASCADPDLCHAIIYEDIIQRVGEPAWEDVCKIGATTSGVKVTGPLRKITQLFDTLQPGNI